MKKLLWMFFLIGCAPQPIFPSPGLGEVKCQNNRNDCLEFAQQACDNANYSGFKILSESANSLWIKDQEKNFQFKMNIQCVD